MKAVGIWLICAALTGALAQEGSDPKAIALAEKTVEAMGGEEAYDNTRYIAWKFFGRRFHVWDKWTGNVRIEDGKGAVILMNVNTKEGKVWQDGEPIEDPDALNEWLDRGYKMWINDSYWVVMPYKLQDPGVTLKYAREDQTEDGRPVDVVTLTFDGVGVTPQNKYEVYIDKESGLVNYWRFFAKAEDAEPAMSTPWNDWKRHGAILLSEDRGQYKHSDLAVYAELPEAVFASPEPIELPPVE